MLDRPVNAVGFGKVICNSGVEPPGRRQRLKRIQRGGRTHRRFAPAVDHLENLGVELHLANAAPSALQIPAGTALLPLRMMIADSPGDILNVAAGAEIKRATPDEGLDRSEERRVGQGWSTCGYIAMDAVHKKKKKK